MLPAVPVVQFTNNLKNQEATEGDKATLSCETSTSDACVTWKKGRNVISEGDKYSIQKNGTIQTLVIYKLTMQDAGEYVCEVGDKQSKATLSIKGDLFFIVSLPCSTRIHSISRIIYNAKITVILLLPNYKLVGNCLKDVVTSHSFPWKELDFIAILFI